MLFKKLIRTAGQYKAQFISMIIMTALGIGMFLGFNMEWVSLEANMNYFFEQTGFADYRIISEEGFSSADLDAILAVEGIDDASRFLAVNAQAEQVDGTLAVTVTENPSVSGFIVMEGEPYDEESEDGLWLFDKFARENDINVGDELDLKYDFLEIHGVVKGLIEASEYMICVQDETQIMPDFGKYGYVYLSPLALDRILSDAASAQILEAAKKELGFLYSEAAANLLVQKQKDNVLNMIRDHIFVQIHVKSYLEAAEFKEAVNEAMGKTMVVLTKDETISYAEAKGEANEGKTMGTILPVLFLLIAILTMVTTMHRIATNEKSQIGTLKALGFRNRRILRHYSSYTAAIGLLGAILGTGLGYLVAWYIMNPDGMMGTYIVMPEWKLFIPWWCWVVMAAVLLIMGITGWLSVKQMVKGTAAQTLQPYVPKANKPLLLEKTRLWEKMKFGTRWNLRDIMRHKSRSIVTLIGIIGCMILMVAAIGMYETAEAFIQLVYTDNARYESEIFVSSSDQSQSETMSLWKDGSVEDTQADSSAATQSSSQSEAADNTAALELAAEYQGDYCTSISVQLDEKTCSLDIYHIEHDLIRFMDKDDNILELPDDGAFVNLRLQEELGISVGDTITVSLFGTDARYEMLVKGVNRSMTQSITISDEYARTLEYEGEALTESSYYRIGNIFTQTQKTDIPDDARISSVQSKTEIAESMDQFMQIMYMAVGVLVLAAIVLGIVVLYNLGVMSYAERYREMATLKVIGFRNKQIRKLLISQNIWITVVGIIVGFVAGVGVLEYLMAALASEYEMKVVIGPLTVLTSVLITFAVSWLVGRMVARKSKKINMVEALKIPE